MTETPSTSSNNGTVEALRGFWYPALRSAQLRGSRLSSAMLLGEPLVVGRDSRSRPFAFLDGCPHRGMPLSHGSFDGELIECCYHGWRFDAQTGECRTIPSLICDSKLKLERIRAKRFPCEEQDGYVWVFVPDLYATSTETPPPPQLPVFSTRYRITHLSADLHCSLDQGIIGLMDPAHGPFVHRSWWWRSRKSIQVKEKIFEPIPNGFRIRAHVPSANSAPYKMLKLYGRPVTSTIEFVLPNMRFEQVRCGDYWFSSRATVTPITIDRCRIDFCAAWNILRNAPFATSVFRLFARMFLRQDQEVMEKQTLGLKHVPSMMLVDDADRPARWYFQLKAAYLKAAQNGGRMEHPIKGPVTLRWRS